MKNWPKEFKTYTLGLGIYTVVTLLLFLGVGHFFPELNFSVLESFGVVMIWVVIHSGYNIWTGNTTPLT